MHFIMKNDMNLIINKNRPNNKTRIDSYTVVRMKNIFCLCCPTLCVKHNSNADIMCALALERSLCQTNKHTIQLYLFMSEQESADLKQESEKLDCNIKVFTAVEWLLLWDIFRSRSDCQTWCTDERSDTQSDVTDWRDKKLPRRFMTDNVWKTGDFHFSNSIRSFRQIIQSFMAVKYLPYEYLKDNFTWLIQFFYSHKKCLETNSKASRIKIEFSTKWKCIFYLNGSY